MVQYYLYDFIICHLSQLHQLNPRNHRVILKMKECCKGYISLNLTEAPVMKLDIILHAVGYTNQKQ